MTPAPKRDLLGLEDWTAGEIESVLQLAQRVKRGELTGGLERRILALVFMQADQFTRIGFESAMFLQGGKSVVLELGEDTEVHLVDMAQALGRTSDTVGLRPSRPKGDWSGARQETLLRDFARRCPRPVINLGSSRRDPCQELADTITLKEKLGRVEGKRFVLTWAWHPHALPTAVPASAALAAARLGMEIVIARPDGYELDSEDTALIRRTAQQAGGEFVHISDDPDDALVGADAVYVASWGSVKLYDKPEQERELRAGLRDWRLTSSRLRSSRGGKGIVLHAFPFLRNGDIEEKVLDSSNSAVFDQVENLVHARRAVLLQLMAEPDSR